MLCLNESPGLGLTERSRYSPRQVCSSGPLTSNIKHVHSNSLKDGNTLALKQFVIIWFFNECDVKDTWTVQFCTQLFTHLTKTKEKLTTLSSLDKLINKEMFLSFPKHSFPEALKNNQQILWGNIFWHWGALHVIDLVLQKIKMSVFSELVFSKHWLTMGKSL